MDLDLQGKNALVVGASRGIGLEIWRGLDAEGANVFVAGHRPETLQAASADSGLTPAGIFELDTASEASIDKLIADLDESAIALDVLVFSVARPGFSDLWNFDFDEWELNVRTKYLGPAHLGRRIAQRMIKRGAGGAIIFLGGIAATGAADQAPATGGANAAIENYVRMLSSAAGHGGVRVVGVSPGTFVTPRSVEHASTSDGGADAWMEEAASRTPLGRVGQPEELASVVTFLASPRAGFLTGTTVTVDGGVTSAARLPIR